MAMSIDGLVTGMSTTATISQLLQVEAAPQRALKAKITNANTVVAAYQSINTRLASLAAAARALGSADGWNPTKATSSSDALTVSTQANAAAGSYNFHVDQLAATHAMTFSGSVASPSSTVTVAPTFRITLADGTTKNLTPADKSLQGVVTAINNETNAKYTAAVVQDSSGKYTLEVKAKGSGAAAAFTSAEAPSGLTLLGSAATSTQGQDAKLTVGSGASAYTVTSATNTFANVAPGVTVTAVRMQPGGELAAKVDITSDPSSIAAKVQALVDTANVALQEIASRSKFKKGDEAAGPLAADTAVRRIAQDILSAVSSGLVGGGSFAPAGVTLNKDGTLAFDKEKFLAGLSADPAKTRAYFDSYTDVTHANAINGKFEPGWDMANGLARKLETIAVRASEGVVNPTNPSAAKQGLLQTLIERRTSVIQDLNNRVDAWDVRLASRKSTLERQFSSLEVALGKMQQQSSWLAGQLAGLA
jgi:flagellar hook-associated protein 2